MKFSLITIILFSEHKICYWIDVTRHKQMRHLMTTPRPPSLSLKETELESFPLHYFHLLSTSATDLASGYGRNSVPCHDGHVRLSEDLWLHFLTCRWCGQLGSRPTTTCCFQLTTATHTQMCSHVNTQTQTKTVGDQQSPARVVFEVGGKRRNCRDNSLLLQLK